MELAFVKKVSSKKNNILSFMESLNELDTSNVEPLIYMTEEKNVFRKDEQKQGKSCLCLTLGCCRG